MYAWIWRHLPGAAWVRVLWAFVLLSVVVFVLFQIVFPALEPRLPLSGGGSLSH